jgi:peptide/nickel transport system ATP-binding protein
MDIQPEVIEEKKASSKRDEVLLSVVDLHVWFELRRFGFGHAGYVRAVDGITFDLNYGETIAIVGESGCGKTSLMKTILGLYKPTKGAVFFEGQNINELDYRPTPKRKNSKVLGQNNEPANEVNPYGMRWFRSQVGYVQQDPYGALPPFMTVQRILEEPLIINGVKNREERIARISKVLEEVKMFPVEDYLGKFPHMLSGGQQQRVVIARSMILNPKLIVADEPVSMLDASVRVEILKLLRNLQEVHHLAVIYITHDLSTVRYFSERIFVMYAGNVVEKAKVADLLRNPLHPYTHALLQGTSDPDARNALSYKEVPPGEPPSLVKPPSGCRFHPRCARFMKGVCDVEVPPDFVLEPHHTAACWLYRPQ